MKLIVMSSQSCAAMLIMILTTAGCQNSGDSFQLAPVDGRVVLESKPVADALVQFSPMKGPTSQGYTDASGQFTLTVSSGSGAVVGSHNVKVTTGLPRPTQADPGASGEPPKEVTVGSTPPTDYIFEAPINVETGNNAIELDLGKAKQRRG